jgi:hypothetical protein
MTSQRTKGTITAVCISREKQSFSLDIPLISYTEGYRDIVHHNNYDMERVSYLTLRYNSAVTRALESYPQTKHVLMVDHYYLPFAKEIMRLIEDYLGLKRTILGGAIWYWNRRRIPAWIAYYDTLSIPEFRNRRWWSNRSLPKGLIPVTGVGGCWVFPREVWETTRGFSIPDPPQAGGSRCLDSSGYDILLDCNCKLWRSHETNPDIPDYSMSQRILTTARQTRKRLWRLAKRHSD